MAMHVVRVRAAPILPSLSLLAPLGGLLSTSLSLLSTSLRFTRTLPARISTRQASKPPLTPFSACGEPHAHAGEREVSRTQRKPTWDVPVSGGEPRRAGGR